MIVNEGTDVIEHYIKKKIRQLREENDLLKKWIRDGNNESSCVVCGKSIVNVSIQRLLRPYRWCSRKCFEYKPRKIIKLEEKYGLDIVDILKETTKKYGNIKAQCGELGISIPYFYSIVNKYCGKDHVAFMATYATGRRKETYAKKNKKNKLIYSPDLSN